jgi:hypothetical protein
MRPHVILDLETLCRKPSAVILEIGALSFDPVTLKPSQSLELTLSPFGQTLKGRTVELDTIAWHANQGNPITFSRWFQGARLKPSLIALRDWLARINPDHVWIWGADFDRPIIENACNSFRIDLPWRYHRTMDARTVWNMAFPDTRHDPRSHRALEDCVASLRDLKAARKHLGLEGTEVAA